MSGQIPAMKAEIIAALRTVRPVPADLIVVLENEQDHMEIENWITTWMRRTKEDWKDLRPDGVDVYNVLHKKKSNWCRFATNLW
jgi:hypothetical protein